MAAFRRAERKQAKLKIALTGPSGAGKTYSALEIATGIGKKIAFADTENRSASLYADRFEFDILEIEPPYTIQKYIDAIRAAEREGYEVLVIDSLSHAWAGDGGLLAKKESLDARGGNSFANWGGITKEHEQFKAMLLNSNIHLICTMRSKQDYVLEINDKGKSSPRKVGLAPIQRDGMEYEFTTVFDIGMDHSAAPSKDRTSLFDGRMFKLTKETGEEFMRWLNGAKPADIQPTQPVDDIPDPKPASVAQGPAPIKSETVAAPQYPQKSGVLCDNCKKELILAASKAGYLCPDSKGPKDGHLRFPVAKLNEYQLRARTLGTAVA